MISIVFITESVIEKRDAKIVKIIFVILAIFAQEIIVKNKVNEYVLQIRSETNRQYCAK